ncbi:MAG: homoserine kinase [Pseudomonadota bacterium]
MAVYTHLGAEDLAKLIAHYDVGELVSAKGIAEGVSNSNWLIETTGNNNGPTRFILTMYERRIELGDLPYFLGLLDHLAARDCPVPRTIHDRDGAAFRMVDGKAVALIEFLPGVSPTEPTPEQARAVGRALAQLHLASNDFELSRTNTLSFPDNLAVLKGCGAEALGSIHPDLPAILESAEAAAAIDLSNLERTNVHADLFPDNVLMLGGKVTGMIDFYFACTDTMALDLATTHAAWCFGPDNSFNPELGNALVRGYESLRPIPSAERALLPEIAKGACIRFVASRAEDWLETPDDALVTRKDPMQFVSRWYFYDKAGPSVFA